VQLDPDEGTWWEVEIVSDWQGGRFDHADRLFSSVPAAWSNCLVNTSDVKELTPEFFYLPDFLINADSFCLGTRQVWLHLPAVACAKRSRCTNGSMPRLTPIFS